MHQSSEDKYAPKKAYKENPRQAPFEKPIPHGHISTAIVISTIWIITNVAICLLIWHLASVVLEPFACVPAVPHWLTYCQPIITLVLGLLISDAVLDVAGVEAHLLPSMRVMVTVDVWSIMAFYTTFLFLYYFVYTTFEYSGNEGKGYYVVVGIFEALAVIVGWIGFFAAWSNGHVFAEKWMDAALMKAEPPLQRKF